MATLRLRVNPLPGIGAGSDAALLLGTNWVPAGGGRERRAGYVGGQYHAGSDQAPCLELGAQGLIW